MMVYLEPSNYRTKTMLRMRKSKLNLSLLRKCDHLLKKSSEMCAHRYTKFLQHFYNDKKLEIT